MRPSIMRARHQAFLSEMKMRWKYIVYSHLFRLLNMQLLHNQGWDIAIRERQVTKKFARSKGRMDCRAKWLSDNLSKSRNGLVIQSLHAKSYPPKTEYNLSILPKSICYGRFWSQSSFRRWTNEMLNTNLVAFVILSISSVSLLQMTIQCKKTSFSDVHPQNPPREMISTKKGITIRWNDVRLLQMISTD
jgi:hypothetical protein